MNTSAMRWSIQRSLGKIENEIPLHPHERDMLLRLGNLGLEAAQYLDLLDRMPTAQERNEARERMKSRVEDFERLCITVRNEWKGK